MKDRGIEIFDECDQILFLKDLKVGLEEYRNHIIRFHHIKFEANEAFSDFREAYYTGLNDGRADIAQDLLRKIDIALNFYS